MSEMVERVGDALRAECMEIFGTNWNYDVAWRFARAAIGAMREPTDAMCDAGAKAMVGTEEDALDCWPAMIDAALKE